MMSVDDGDSTIAIPSSLRTIQPFLDDAQKFLRQARRMNSGPMNANYIRSSITCVNLGFRVSYFSLFVVLVVLLLYFLSMC